MCAAACGLLGSPQPRSPIDFSCRRSLAISAVPPKRFHTSDSAILSATPLQSSFASHASPIVPEGTLGHTCLDFAPSSRHHALASTSLRGFPLLAYVPPAGFHNLSTYFSHARSQAYFIPLPRPGLSCSGSSPRTQPPLLVGRSLPPCRCSRRAHHRSSVRPPCPRLRGFDPRESALPSSIDV